MPEQVRYRTKLTQSSIFLVRYQTKIRDAGMLMPALVFWMPMPSYGDLRLGNSRSKIKEDVSVLEKVTCNLFLGRKVTSYLKSVTHF
jgi:hypothetical protein